MFEELFIVFLGATVGVLVGMTGMGGGALLTPALITIVGISPVVAVSSDIIYGAVTKLFGSIQHIRQKTVDFHLVRWLAVGSVPGAILGSVCASLFSARGLDINTTITTVLGILLCCIATILFVSTVFDVTKLKKSIHDSIGAEKHYNRLLVIVGFFGGGIVGLTSVGSGTVMMAAILVISNTSLKKIVGSDIVHATILLCTAGITHLFVGKIDWMLVLFLLVGSIPGVMLGSRISQYAPKNILKFFVIALLGFFGVKLLL